MDSALDVRDGDVVGGNGAGDLRFGPTSGAVSGGEPEKVLALLLPVIVGANVAGEARPEVDEESALVSCCFVRPFVRGWDSENAGLREDTKCLDLPFAETVLGPWSG